MGLPVENDLLAITLIASAQIIELNQNLAPKGIHRPYHFKVQTERVM